MKPKTPLFATGSLLFGTLVAGAQTNLEWRAEAANGNWEDSSNWWDGLASQSPPGAEILSFGNNNQVAMTNDAVNTTRHRILFLAGASTVRTIAGTSENTFAAVGENGPLIRNESAVGHNLNFPMGIAAAGLTTEPASGPLNLNGALSGSGTFTKSLGNTVAAGWDGGGVNNVVVSGNNAGFSGKWIVNGGNLSINADAALGAVPAILVADAVTLNGGGLANMTAANGTGFGAGHDLTLDATRGISIGANGGNIRIGYGRTVTVNGPISGTGRLSRTDGGTLIFNGVNTYGGITHLRAGTTRTGVNGAVPATTNVLLWGGSTLDLNGTTQSIAGIHVGGTGDTNTTLQLGTNGSLTVTGNAMPAGSPTNIGGDFVARVRGTGTITYAHATAVGGAVHWDIRNNTNDFTGTWVIRNGRLRIQPDTLADTSLGNLENDIVFDGEVEETLLNQGGRASLQVTNGQSVTHPATRSFTINSGKEGTFYTWGGTTQIVEGIVTGGGNLRKEDGGTLRMNNTGNDYTGRTRIAAGTILAGAAGVIPDVSPLEIDGGNLNLNNLAETVASLSGASGAVNGGGTLTVLTTGDETYSGQIQNATTLHMGGTGTQRLAGATDNGNGWASVSSGTLVLAKSGPTTSRSVGRSNGEVALTISGGVARLDGTHEDQIYGDSSVLITGGTLDMNGRNDSFRGLIGGGGSVRNDAVDTFSTLTVGEIINAGAANYTYTGEITDGAGNLALTKIGAGTQVLGGVNSYTGPTNVSLGTLQVESGIPGSVVTVFSGGTFALGSTASQYPVAGFVLGAGGVFSSLVDSGTSTARQLQVGGDVFLDGGALSLTDLGAATLPLGTKLTLITYTGSLSGTFDALPEGGTLEVGSNTFAIAYQDAGAVTLTAVQPASGYDQWALTHAPGQLPEQDYDLDGVANGIEWVVGGTKDTNDASKLPVVTLTPTQMVFTFRRVLASKTPDTTVSIEVGTTLASWPDSYDVETAPEVTVVSSDAESETLALTVPRGTDTAKFARLVVVID